MPEKMNGDVKTKIKMFGITAKIYNSKYLKLNLGFSVGVQFKHKIRSLSFRYFEANT